MSTSQQAVCIPSFDVARVEQLAGAWKADQEYQGLLGRRSELKAKLFAVRSERKSLDAPLVDRLVVLHGGGFIGEGAPQTVIASRAVREIYMGIPADA